MDEFATKASPESKKARITLKEEVIIIVDDFEEEEMAEVKDEAILRGEVNLELVEPNANDPVIFLLHICLLCDMELDCAPGDIVMKTHYISHYSPGSLLEMVGHDVGEKLRCPYSECHMGIGEEMLLQQLNLHLEVAHNKLRMLLEKDTSPGMAELLSIMYDFDTYKAMKLNQNFSEKELAQNEGKVENVASLNLPPMKANVEEEEVSEEHYVVQEDLTWTINPLYIDESLNDDDGNEEKNVPDSTWTLPCLEEHDERDPSWTPPLHIDDESDSDSDDDSDVEKNDPSWAPHIDDEKKNETIPSWAPRLNSKTSLNQNDEIVPLYSVEVQRLQPALSLEMCMPFMLACKICTLP